MWYSQGALNSLTIGLVKPLAQQGIRINTVSPGMTATDMIADTAKGFDLSQIPLGRFGQASKSHLYRRRGPFLCNSCSLQQPPASPPDLGPPRLAIAHIHPRPPAPQPSEIADAVCWLCSAEASYVAGANIRVAGGRPPGTTIG